MRAAVILALLLAGCAHDTRRWYHENQTQQMYDVDAGQCEAQGHSIPGAGIWQIDAVMNACMRGKGWVLR